MKIIQKYFIYFSIIYWIVVSAFAIEPGYAIFDKDYLIIMAVGFVVWLALAVNVYNSSIKKHAIIWIASVLSVLTIVISPIFLIGIIFKDIKVEETENPFEYLDGGTGTAIYRTSFLDWPYWMPNKLKKQHLKLIQPDRLIKYSQNEQYLRIRGIEESLIIEAFGEPDNQYTEGDYEIWEYHPWKEHRKWIMPVYLKDGTLWSIGDPE